MLEEAPVDVVDRHRITVVEVDADRCDARECGARAFVYAEMPSGNSLSFCGHHGGEYLEGLAAQGATVIDLRHLIGHVS